MPEVYIGTKFDTVFLDSNVQEYTEISRMRFWAERFADLDMTPQGGEGNISFRTENGFIVTATASQFSSLKNDDFVEVVKVDTDDKVFYVHGCKEPSSESFMHHAIFQQRNDIYIIFHTHDHVVMDHNHILQYPETTQEQEYGTLKLVKEVLTVSSDNDYFIIKNHGVVALAENMGNAGEMIISAHNNATKLNAQHNA